MAVLGAGVINYFFTRPDIFLFRLFSIDGEPLFIPRSSRAFFAGYFSDIAWCLALCASVLLLTRSGHIEKYGRTLMLALPFLTEAAQHFSFLPGTFDWWDVLVYALIEFVFIVRFIKPRI